MKKIVFITAEFPFGTGETFIETEIKFWEPLNKTEVILMPLNKSSIIREFPKSINLDDTLFSQKIDLFRKIINMPKVFFNKVFYQEIFNPDFKYKALPVLINSVVKFMIYKKKLHQYILSNTDKKLIFYTYWHNEITYALQSLKNKYPFQIVTRTHRYDLYQEERKYKYMPLKKQFISYIDKIFVITDSAKNYLVKTYGFDEDIIETARLGVKDLSIVTKPTDENNLHIVSCSSLIRVKRVEKIIKALSLLSESHPKLHIMWTHFGDGYLKKDLQQLSEKILKNSNIQYFFKGHVSNKYIYDFYRTNKVDLLINVSKSEGVPVSIMEAMSCHIPVIAPNVGGIKDMLIDDYNGILLSSDATINEIIEALKNYNFFKKDSVRNNSYQMYIEKYDANKNYLSFVNKINTM